MTDQGARMVLRTVYLTPEMDEKLRIGAFQAGRSKNDLIRDAITQFLAEIGKPQQGKAEAEANSAAKKATAKKAVKAAVAAG
jgi:predicted DNA-binding protein